LLFTPQDVNKIEKQVNIKSDVKILICYNRDL